MEFPNPRTTPSAPAMLALELAELTRQLHWVYDGAPPVLPGRRRGPVDDVALWLVQTGAAQLNWGDESLTVPAGHWVLPPSPSDLTQEFAPGTRLLSLRFAARWANGTPLLPLERPLVFARDDHPELFARATYLVKATGTLPPPAATRLRARPMAIEQLLLIDAGLCTLLATLLRILAAYGVTPRHRPQPIDARVRQAMAMLNQPDTTPRDIARQLSISVSQLDRLFVRALGTTPHALRQRQRLDTARHRLRQTNDPIKAIAYATHFRRISHFSAWFSKSTGMSPRAYRQLGDTLA